MTTLGFNNFRRFTKFPEIDLGDITLLVGANNSGKSTLVKALLLCVDNIRLMTLGQNSGIFNTRPLFRFDANEYHDVKIKTFARAIHNKPAPSLDPLDDKLSLPTQIQFKFTLGNFKFDIVIAGDRDSDEVTGAVSYVSIEDRGNMVSYSVNYLENTMSYSVLGSTSERETLIQRLYKDYKNAKETLESLSEAGEDISAISTQSEITASLEKRIEEFVNVEGDVSPDDFDYEKALKNEFRESQKNKYTSTTWDIPLVEFIDSIKENIFVHIIGNFIGVANNPGENIQEKLNRITNPEEYAAAMQAFEHMEEARSVLKQDVDKIKDSQADLKLLLNSFNVEYITAHVANQNTIYNTADRNDYIAQTVHEYARLKILGGEEEYRFVTDWMKKFGIGSKFEIIPIDGEAYRVKIKDSDGSEVNLADKGMGSIQMMILLLRLATILRTYKPQNIVSELYIPIIIIEEPEQNLHPNVQSELADLFAYLNKEYRLKFIVETHSEYLIRKTQVLIANENYEDDNALKENNPFLVYYFDGDNDKTPYYQMRYDLSGSFKDKFGDGFFDEASKWDMAIIRKEFELKKKNRK